MNKNVVLQYIIASVTIMFFLVSSVLEANEDKLVLRVVDAEGKPIARAKVGTGINIFENSEKHPPQTITMWLRGRKRSWPFRSDENGMVVLTSKDAAYREFYGIHEARGLVGFLDVKLENPKGVIELKLEPACHVYGKLTSVGLEKIGQSLSSTTTFLSQKGMYFVSEKGDFEFLMPAGSYQIRCVGKCSNGIGTKDIKRNFTVEEGQRELNIGKIDLPPTKLATLAGKIAPKLQIKKWKNGEPVKLDDLRGKIVILEFWGHWCGPCIQEMPELMKLHDSFSGKDVVIIAVHDNSVTSVEELDSKLREIRKKHWDGRDIPFLIAIDSGDDSGATHSAYGIKSWPTTLVIDKEGKVYGKYSPYQLDNEILPRLLGEQNTTP